MGGNLARMFPGVVVIELFVNFGNASRHSGSQNMNEPFRPRTISQSSPRAGVAMGDDEDSEEPYVY